MDENGICRDFGKETLGRILESTTMKVSSSCDTGCMCRNADSVWKGQLGLSTPYPRQRSGQTP
jgi:hypothetical protein